MRPLFGMPDISDGSSFVPPPPVEGGWSLSTDASPMDPLCPLLIYAIDREERFSPLPEEPWCLLASPPDRVLPQTMHQRLYQWPDSGVGPHIVVEGVVKDSPPKELSPMIAPWAFPLLPPVVSSFDPVAKNWDPTTKIEDPSEPPNMYASQGFFWQITRRTDNPHFSSFLRGGWIGDASQDAFYISGVTLDANSTPLGGCTVVLLDADKLIANPDPFANPVLDVEISNASTGAYSFPVSGGKNYQVVAYLPGSPDVAGVTRKDVRGVAV